MLEYAGLTLVKKCDKMKEPNKIQYVFPEGYVFLFLVKTLCRFFPYSFGKLNFVWRQSGYAFFGAYSFGCTHFFILGGKREDSV